MLSFSIIAFCVVSETLFQLCFKVASNASVGMGGGLVTVLKQPMTWLGLLFWLLETLGWIKALQLLPLHVAYPLMSLTYIGIPISSALFLKEKLNVRYFAAAGLISSGVVLVAVSPS